MSDFTVQEAESKDLDSILHILSQSESYSREKLSGGDVQALRAELHEGALGEFAEDNVVTLTAKAKGYDKVLAFLTFLVSEQDDSTGELVTMVMDWGYQPELSKICFSLFELIPRGGRESCVIVKVPGQDIVAREALQAMGFEIDRYEYWKKAGTPERELESQDLLVRRANESDMEAVFDLFAEGEENLQPEGRDPNWEVMEEKLTKLENEGLKTALSDPGSAIFVAECEQNIIAFVWCRTDQDDESPEFDWSIYRFGVDDDSWESDALAALEQMAFRELATNGLAVSLPRIGEDTLLQEIFEGQGYLLDSVDLHKYPSDKKS